MVIFNVLLKGNVWLIQTFITELWVMFLLKGFGESWDVGQRSQKVSEQVGPLWKHSLLLL